MEYAVILFLLKARRKPLRTIDHGFKIILDGKNGNNNGDALQPLRSPSPKRGNGRRQAERVAGAGSGAVTEGKQALVENIDAWAMWIAPPVFIFWNLCYWVSYRPWTNRLVSEDTLVTRYLTDKPVPSSKLYFQLDYVLQRNV